jgi:superkiller protein 3
LHTDIRPEKKAEKPKETKVVSQKAVSMISSMISSGPKPKKERVDDPETPPLFRSKKLTKPKREEALEKTETLAKGFVLLDVASPGADEAWSWVLEGKDEPTLCE